MRGLGWAIVLTALAGCLAALAYGALLAIFVLDEIADMDTRNLAVVGGFFVMAATPFVALYLGVRAVRGRIGQGAAWLGAVVMAPAAVVWGRIALDEFSGSGGAVGRVTGVLCVALVMLFVALALTLRRPRDVAA